MKLEDIEKLIAKATPGPWGLRLSDGTLLPKGWFLIEEEGIDLSIEAASHDVSNARFIAASRTLMPKLLDVAKAADRLARHHKGIEGGWLFALKQLEDLMADDWEIQEKAVTITRTQFYEAVKAYQNVFWPDPAANLIARKLGLEEP